MREEYPEHHGCHRFGLRANSTQPAGKWIERFEEWLADGGFLKKP